jgi:hypothetical protein
VRREKGKGFSVFVCHFPWGRRKAYKGRFFLSPAIFAGFLSARVLWSVMPAQAGIQARCSVSSGITGFPLSRE